ncbi:MULTISPECIES: maleylpyruvate isomerase N-terminal domain-containing protein [unclassified Solwaraspora]|uniref:maleylpyruvate isomerase N-terminal domain-containing protein n=1 Tax=unclassified Solwaraspora TaxID=2627926 RepID=UPI00259B586D|nr:maleylpyruvate isomerase N-terminal domain-containing protein [Solwaraspora sp. WMMA2056]WJK38557.1 maleylpyruvate isomerase family mycothiol-dependent enzyme [Solwaraspora sp. WMMA2056]
MTRAEAAATMGWLTAGEQRCRDLVDQLSDADAAAPSRLPGWTRAHLVTHLARNADALVNLLTWARTGRVSPMYASAAERGADIDAGAGRGADELRADLAGAAGRLADAVRAMPDDAWSATVRTGQGREVPADQVLWLRVREVWVHQADLDLGGTLADLPGPLTDALLNEVTATYSHRGTGPAVRLRATDRRRSWRVVTGSGSPSGAVGVGGTGRDRSVELSGTAGELLGWLIGRVPASRLTVRPVGAAVAAPPPWI